MAKKHSSTRQSSGDLELLGDLSVNSILERQKLLVGLIERLEKGEAQLSREKASHPMDGKAGGRVLFGKWMGAEVEGWSPELKLEEPPGDPEVWWTQLEKSFQANDWVPGIIVCRAKGGFTVLLNALGAFLPRSQADIRPVRDITPLLGSLQPFKILKMDRSRRNIVVSRRAVLEDSRAKQRFGKLFHSWHNTKKHSSTRQSSDVVETDPVERKLYIISQAMYNTLTVKERSPGYGPQEQFNADTSKDLGERRRSLWAERRVNTDDAGLTPPEFIQKHYADLIAKGDLTHTVVRQRDASLYFAYHRWRQRHPNAQLEFSMPKQSEVTEARYRERYGRAGARILNVIREEGRERVRRHRQNKSTRS